MQHFDSVPLVEITRGKIVESLQFGVAVVVSADGKLLASSGNPDSVAFLRSSAKPFQVLPFLAAGGMQHFDLTLEEVAIMCASHTGTDRHVEVVRGILKKIGLDETALQCGIHPPGDGAAYVRMMRNGEKPTPARHNCSGKHSGFLAYSVMTGAPVDSYLDPAHPVQRDILANFAVFCDMRENDIETGVDGCSAPVFAVPMRKAALAMARLVDPAFTPSGMHSACQTVIQAMQAYPEMISGPGRFDTLLLQCGKNRWILKGGAEGYQILGILPGVLSPGSPGVGIAIKVSDGDLMRPTPATDAEVEDLVSPTGNPGGRSIPLVTLEVLRQLQVLPAECQEELKAFDRRPVLNWQKLPVGEIRPCFTLERNA